MRIREDTMALDDETGPASRRGPSSSPGQDVVLALERGIDLDDRFAYYFIGRQRAIRPGGGNKGADPQDEDARGQSPERRAPGGDRMKDYPRPSCHHT